MKSSFLYAVAAALFAAPIGWILAGVLRALELMSSVYRPAYLSGDYTQESVIASLLAFSIVFLVFSGRRIAAATKTVAK